MDTSVEIKLPLLHLCDEYCKNNYILGMFPNGENKSYDSTTKTCKKNRKIINTCPQIIDCLTEDIFEKKNKSYFIKGDKIVINENNICIIFSYPLDGSVSFDFESINGNGFTRKELVNLICKTYQRIYKEEEESITDFYGVTKCNNCNNINIDSSKSYKLSEDVSINSKYVDDTCHVCDKNILECVGNSSKYMKKQFMCGHIFHKKCINKYLKTNDDCPGCKKLINQNETIEFNCEKCNSNSVNFIFTGKIVPFEYRKYFGPLVNRHETNGKYGIWGHDLSDLCLEGIYYNKATGTVTLDIGS
jgi:hypothetical protein